MKITLSVQLPELSVSFKKSALKLHCQVYIVLHAPSCLMGCGDHLKRRMNLCGLYFNLMKLGKAVLLTHFSKSLSICKSLGGRIDMMDVQ